MASVNNDSSSGCRALRARYVFPVLGEPLAGGVLTIRGERIIAVGTNESGRPAQDLGSTAILPGLVNAHTHLEFSALAAPLAEPGTPLPEWIRKVLEYRRIRGDAAAAVAGGLRECLASGTTAIGEIATRVASSSSNLPTASLDATVFLELIGLSPASIDEQVALAEGFLREFSVEACPHPGPLPAGGGAGSEVMFRWRAGLSPHAPYTIHPEMLARCASLSRHHGAPLAMHLAESREELELLRSGSGGMRELLDQLNAWSPEAIGRGSRVLDYLRALSRADRGLVIHGNYLDQEETAFLAGQAERLSVVFCPRTHDYFRHAPYPLARMVGSGVAMALGTDSRASNPDLSLYEEMRFVAQRHADMSPPEVLEMGTIGGARALGIAKETGSLTPGKFANLAIVQLSSTGAKDPHELLFTNETRVVETWFRGARVARGP